MDKIKEHKKLTITLVLFSPLICLVLIILHYIFWSLIRTKGVPETPPFITSVPTQLEKISAISYFRSCAGHDFSGYNVDGQFERNRSMKHYFNPLPELNEMNNEIEIYAPFDGEIVILSPDEGLGEAIFSNERGKFLLIKEANTDWHFGIFHIDLLETVEEGDKVSSGELLGYASLKGAGNFDFSLQYGSGDTLFEWFVSEIIGFDKPSFFNQLDSMFNHMSEDVKAEFRRYDVPVDDMIISKETRDSLGCDFDSYEPANFFTWVYELDAAGNPIY